VNVLRIQATVDDLATVRQFVRAQAERAGANHGAVPDIVQAVDEFVTNSIVHGYRGGGGPIEVEVDKSGTSLVVRLRNETAVRPGAAAFAGQPRRSPSGGSAASTSCHSEI
jgi:anti-sigma regulatory factor (Ser/Thr protein kinase)